MSRVTFWLHLILPQFPSLSISNWINPTKSPTLLSSLQQKRASSETEATTYYIDYYALQLQHNTREKKSWMKTLRTKRFFETTTKGTIKTPRNVVAVLCFNNYNNMIRKLCPSSSESYYYRIIMCETQTHFLFFFIL
jgi:hypothetical protein